MLRINKWLGFVGVKNEFPVNKEEPLVGAAYHFMFPAEAVAFIVTVEPHTDDGSGPNLPGYLPLQ
jgi:hypothetical protein